MDKLLNLLALIALEVAGSVAALSGKAIAIIASVLGLVICLCVLMSNGKPQEDDFVPQLRLPFKNKEECYEVVDERRRKCEAEGRHPILCVDDEYCDERGCC